MINEVENKASLNAMSDLEHDKNELEMMRYRANSLSYMLGFLGIILSLLGAFVCMNSTNPEQPIILFKILLNIAIVLFGFLCCEKTKAYSKQGSLVLIGLGVVCGARIFWIPLQLIVQYSIWSSNIKNTADAVAQEKAAAAAKYIGKTITNPSTTSWLPQSGTFRGIFAIVLLAIAAAAFIGAGAIGYIRSTKLAKYLNSINEKK